MLWYFVLRAMAMHAADLVNISKYCVVAICLCIMHEILPNHVVPWPLYHFLFHFGLGLMCPNRWIIWAIVSTIWEYIELVFSNHVSVFAETDNDKTMDIMVNMIGFTFGSVYSIKNS